MDLELLSALIFYSSLLTFFYLKRERVKVFYKVVLGYTTERGITFLRSIAKHEKIVKIMSTISIPIALYFMFVASSQLILSLYYSLIENMGPSIAFVVPGVKIPGSPVFFPFFYTILSIAILAIIHEFSHAIVAISEKIRVKHMGFGLFLMFFLAFVELDEEEMKKRSPLSRMRVAAAGPVSNIIFALFIAYLLLVLDPLLSSHFAYTGVQVVDVMEDYPAQRAGMKQGMVIIGIDNQSITNLTGFSLILSHYLPNQTISVRTDEGVFNLTLASNPENESLPYIGIYVSQAFRPKDLLGQISYVIFGLPHFRSGTYEKGLFGWLFLLSFFVGIMNLLPILGLDGSIILNSLFSYVMSEKKANLLTYIISYFFLIILILTAFLPYFLKII